MTYDSHREIACAVPPNPLLSTGSHSHVTSCPGGTFVHFCPFPADERSYDECSPRTERAAVGRFVDLSYRISHEVDTDLRRRNLPDCWLLLVAGLTLAVQVSDASCCGSVPESRARWLRSQLGRGVSVDLGSSDSTWASIVRIIQYRERLGPWRALLAPGRFTALVLFP